MEISKTLRPGDMGTRRHLEQYGEQLICVRYRIDKIAQKRYTTIELVVDEKPYIATKTDIFAWVKINYDEFEARQKLKTAGAKWLIEEKVWIVHYDTAKKLGLKKRIIKTTTTKYDQI